MSASFPVEDALFRAALQRPVAERYDYLEHACGLDAELRRRVEGRLASHHDSEGDTKETVHVPQMEESGRHIGRYRLLKEIGAGGFGQVWQAEQEGPIPRRVAVKVVKLGMDTRDIIAQFEAERQLLALMDHPNIAKVFDAGTTDDGLPYFVMELVEGVPLTQFCEQRRLPTSERLRLFVMVCQALQHAHQKGVIHRDIKPSNILVSIQGGVPLPKVIDFGIARAICPILGHSQGRPSCGQMIGTPAYMSPEQAVGEIDIDTRCDVYALGVLLYELLTGRRPFDEQQLAGANPAEIHRLISTRPAPRPSEVLAALDRDTALKHAARHRSTPAALREALLEDLDWIVMKGMQRDRELRYETANGLAMDVERHLTNEFVRAHPDSRLYRLRKLVKRNKLVYTMGTLIAVALMIGISVSASQASRATQAEREQSTLRGMAEENGRKAYEQKEAARQALAQAQIALADAAYRDQDGSAMQAALHAVPEDLRDSSWHYLVGKSDTSVASIEAPGGRAVDAAVPHPTLASVFITVSTDHWVSVSQLGANETLLRFPLDFADHSTPDFSIAVSPDGEHLAVGKRSGDHIAIHSLKDGSVMASWKSPGTDALAYSPDGKRLLELSREAGTCMHNATTGEILWSATGDDSFQDAVFDKTGRSLLGFRSANGLHLQLINAFNGTLLRELTTPRTRVTALAISIDGRQAFTGDQRGFVRCLDLKIGEPRYEFRASDRPVSGLAYALDGKRFCTLSNLSGGRQSIRLWDCQTGVFLQPLLQVLGAGRELCVHPLSGEILATGLVAKAWRLEGRAEEIRMSARDFSTTCFWNSEDLIFAQGTKSSVDLIDLQKKEAAQNPVWQAPGQSARIVTSSADGMTAAVGCPAKLASEIRILRLDGGRVVETRTLTAPGGMTFMHLNAASDQILIRAANTFNVVETSTGHSVSLPWNRDFAVREAAWLGASTKLVALLTARSSRGMPGSEDHLVLYDATTGDNLASVKNSSVINAIATSPDGKLLAEGGADRKVRLRDANTLEVRSELRVHDGPIMALAFHPSGTMLATASEDLTIKLWNLADGRLLEEMHGPLGAPRLLAFSPAGHRLACQSEDRTLRVWNLAHVMPAMQTAEDLGHSK